MGFSFFFFFPRLQLWNTCHQPDLVKPSLKKSLEDLGLKYLDLYLMHWPMAYKVRLLYTPQWNKKFYNVSQHIPTSCTGPWHTRWDCCTHRSGIQSSTLLASISLPLALAHGIQGETAVEYNCNVSQHISTSCTNQSQGPHWPLSLASCYGLCFC